MYTTKSCPENEIEWNRKSSAFNCSKESSYACFPNNETTELIEFCYPLRSIIIPEGSEFFYFFKDKLSFNVREAEQCKRQIDLEKRKHNKQRGCPLKYKTKVFI